MEEGFSPRKTHQENIKVSIDTILNKKTTLRKVKKTEDDHKKIVFCRILNSLLEADERTMILDEEHMMDMRKYDTLFHVIIEDLLELHYTKSQVNLINFFLYDRYTPEGLVDLVMEDGNVMVLETPEDLYYALKHIK